MKRFLLSALLTLLASGSVRADPARRPAPAPAPVTATGGVTGGIKGTVTFEGEAPDRKTLVRDTDPYCARTARLADDVVVTKGKLRDVLVRIKNGSGGTHAAPPAPVVIDQRECMYSPRVVGLVAGQKLALRNSDGTFHNVHGTIAGKLLWNKPQSAKDPDLALDPGARPGDVIDIVCDVHPWMHSYAVVQDHPFFAITGDDGTFEIQGLTAGTYTLEAWHPTLGLKTLTVKIGTGAKRVVPARISYKANER